MTTWKRGRELMGHAFRRQMVPLADLFELLRVERPARPPGAAVYMTSNREGTPPALLMNFTHNRTVHQHVVLLTLSPGMALWRERLFAVMTRNAQPATAFFKLPTDHVLEMGSQIAI